MMSNMSDIQMKPKLGCISLDRVHIDVVRYVQDAQKDFDGYLFPCIIEYSLMSLTVFFILWQGTQHRFGKLKGNSK